MLDEPALQWLAAYGDALYLLATTLFDNVETLPIPKGKVHFVKERNCHDVFWVGRRICVDADGVEDKPCRHLTCIVHSCIGKSFLAHPVILMHQGIEDVLGLFLVVDEIVSEGDAVSWLIAMAVSAEIACKVPSLITAARNGEERVEFLFDGLLRGIEGYHSHRVVRGEEE